MATIDAPMTGGIRKPSTASSESKPACFTTATNGTTTTPSWMLVHEVVYDWLEAYFHLPRPIWKLFPAFEPHRLKSLLSEIMMMAEDMTSFFYFMYIIFECTNTLSPTCNISITVTNTNRIATY
jgi:hypothetical protein